MPFSGFFVGLLELVGLGLAGLVLVGLVLVGLVRLKVVGAPLSALITPCSYLVGLSLLDMECLAEKCKT